MAQSICPNKHRMWNGDGRVCVDAYRIKYVEEFCEAHSERVIDYEADGDEYFAMYDLFDLGDPKEEYDIWRCTKCKALSIWNYGLSYYYGYKVLKDTAVNDDAFRKWEKYFVLNDDANEDFIEKMDQRKLSPIDALRKFAAETSEMYYAYVSDDHKTIVVTDNDDRIFRIYELSTKVKIK